jgi:sugar phosphate isomerase/epimerase
MQIMTTILLGLNGATISNASLEQALVVAKQAGFGGFEPRVPSLAEYASANRVKKVLTTLANLGLVWLPLNALENVFAWDQATLAAQATAIFSLALRFQIPYLILVPGPAQLSDALACARLTWLKAQGAQYHVELLYELIGFRSFAFPNLTQAYHLANTTGIPLVLDTFHLAISQTSPKDIMRLSPKAIGLVHLSDAITTGKTLEELNDIDRVLPGEGGLPLTDLMAAIYQVGYRGPISVEVFHPKYQNEDPYKVAAEAMSRTKQLLKDAGWPL